MNGIPSLHQLALRNIQVFLDQHPDYAGDPRLVEAVEALEADCDCGFGHAWLKAMVITGNEL